ncbi:MAG: TonB-dependent receptor family protein [Panacagrimonas sp.]
MSESGARHPRLLPLCAALSLSVSGAVVADPIDPSDSAEWEVAATQLDTVTVTATRVEKPSFEVPASVDVIGGESVSQDTLGINLSEGLAAVPGMQARDRQNYAQDTQISIRGFGSRATFGIRGLRLYLDGIPATQPDGQGQVSHFNLATAERIEVLRGPFSTLYGNSSGGVIQMFTAEGGDSTRISGGTAAGSFDTWRANLGASGPLGDARYNFDYTRFETEGFRDHSRAERESFNSKLSLPMGEGGKLSLVLNHFDSPDTQDPLGLTREQLDQDPSQATPVAEQFNTRKSAKQTQGGAVYERDLSENQQLRALVYTGTREVVQFLSIPTGPQNSPTSAGGVVDLDSNYLGTDLRWTYRGALAGRPITWVAGLNYDELSQDRLGYQNFVGTDVGIRGALKRDEVNDIDNFDQYLQANIDIAPRWSALLGLRHSKVAFDSQDRFITATNPDDSGEAEYSETTPAAGLLFRYTPQLHLYAAYGRGFETPTFAELAYRPDGASGLNFDLKPALTDNSEVGAKWKLSASTRVNLALFHARTEDELVVATNSGGRSTFQNAGRTQRQGAELMIETSPAPLWTARLAWTWLDASVREDYITCAAAPCPLVPTPETQQNLRMVERGNDIPGIAESSLFASLVWGGASGWHAGIEARYLDAVPVNDLNVASAPSYGLVGLDAGYVFAPSWGRLRTFVKVENLFDEDYVGSVIVNDGNGRFYEPGPERSVLAGLRLDWS